MGTLQPLMKFHTPSLFDRSNRDESELSDFELLMQGTTHNRRALEVLYTRYSAKALGLAFKVLHDRDLAEEIVVDAFWRVSQRADHSQLGRGSFSSWFYGIVRHLSIDELRRRDARPAPSEDEQLEIALASDASHENDVTEIVVRNLNADTVQHALEELPPTQREVILLAYFEGLRVKRFPKNWGSRSAPFIPGTPRSRQAGARFLPLNYNPQRLLPNPSGLAHNLRSICSKRRPHSRVDRRQT